MRSRIIVSKNGQTLVARGNEYVSPSQSATTVLTSRQFKTDQRSTYRAMRTNGDALERAWIYGNPRAVSKAALKRAARLEKARSQPMISPAEAIAMLESLKRADEAKAKLAAREKERAEELRREKLEEAQSEEAKEARRKLAQARMGRVMGFNKSA